MKIKSPYEGSVVYLLAAGDPAYAKWSKQFVQEATEDLVSILDENGAQWWFRRKTGIDTRSDGCDPSERSYLFDTDACADWQSREKIHKLVRSLDCDFLTYKIPFRMLSDIDSFLTGAKRLIDEIKEFHAREET